MIRTNFQSCLKEVRPQSVGVTPQRGLRRIKLNRLLLFPQVLLALRPLPLPPETKPPIAYPTPDPPILPRFQDVCTPLTLSVTCQGNHLWGSASINAPSRTLGPSSTVHTILDALHPGARSVKNKILLTAWMGVLKKVQHVSHLSNLSSSRS